MIDIEWITDIEYERNSKCKIGDIIQSKHGDVGVIKYIGPLEHFAERNGDNTVYIGVDKTVCSGYNSRQRHGCQFGTETCYGKIFDKQYFEAPKGTGVFIKADHICGLYRY